MSILTADSEAAPDSKLDKLKDNSLKAAGWAYLVGDAALYASGMMAGRPNEANAGLLYTIGGLTCARYGNPGAERQLKLLSQRLGRYLRKQGIEIPKTPDTAALIREGGLIEHIETFLYAYPSQVLNATYGIGGVQLAISGMRHQKKWDAASGALVAAGGLAGLLIAEKKPNPEHPPEGFLDKISSWIQEKPLRLSGGLYGLNNITLTISAFEEMRKNPAQKSYLFKFLTAGSYIFANAMLSMSSKSHGGGAHADIAMEKLADVSAQVIAAQAPPVREALVQQIAAYLSAQPEIHLKAHEIADALHRKLAEVGKGMPVPAGWAQRLESVSLTSVPHAGI